MMYFGNTGREWVWGKNKKNQFQSLGMISDMTFDTACSAIPKTSPRCIKLHQVSLTLHPMLFTLPLKTPLLHCINDLQHPQHISSSRLSSFNPGTPIMLKSAVCTYVVMSWCQFVLLFLLLFFWALNETRLGNWLQYTVMSFCPSYRPVQIQQLQDTTWCMCQPCTPESAQWKNGPNGVHALEARDLGIFVDLLHVLLISLFFFIDFLYRHPSISFPSWRPLEVQLRRIKGLFDSAVERGQAVSFHKSLLAAGSSPPCWLSSFLLLPPPSHH